jgi:2-oxoglutarate/2-oxoacid ferredoxin oxidoreductase subunit alpha
MSETHDIALLRGNEAVGAGALRAGCRFFFGYPITPQNELFEYMAQNLPPAGGTFLQSESELAGINMLFGASAAGARCMTSSSGPGFTLLSEGLTALAAAQLPAVVVCVSRAGPGLGRIASSQAVFGPAGAQELFELTCRAFELADRYRNPVIVLSDAILGQMMEPVDTTAVPPQAAPEKAWAVRGKGDQGRKVVKVAPHTDEELIAWNRELKAKYEGMAAAEQRHEAAFLDGAVAAVVAFGSSARIALDAVTRARQAGMPVGLFRPISLFPYPEKALREVVASGVRRLLVVEANNGQMVEDVRLAVCGAAEIRHYGTGGGHIFSPDEIFNEIRLLNLKS